MKDVKDLHIGVLALQGDFERHGHQLDLAGATTVPVRYPIDLEKIDGLIIPGGESTTMDYLINRYGLRDPLLAFGRVRPVWGTCAGLILLAKRIEDNRAGVQPLGLLDVDIVRNGYGRQVFSFEQSITAHLGERKEQLTATFIRAPRITRFGNGVQMLAEYNDSPVLVSSNNILASCFHSELDDDIRLLSFFIEGFVLA